MVTLPIEFVSTKFPGYFWNTANQQLYSVKSSGVLRPLKYTRASTFTHGVEGYRVCVRGYRRWLTLSYLKSIPHDQTTIYPVEVRPV